MVNINLDLWTISPIKCYSALEHFTSIMICFKHSHRQSENKLDFLSRFVVVFSSIRWNWCLHLPTKLSLRHKNASNPLTSTPVRFVVLHPTSFTANRDFFHSKLTHNQTLFHVQTRCSHVADVPDSNLWQISSFDWCREENYKEQLSQSSCFYSWNTDDNFETLQWIVKSGNENLRGVDLRVVGKNYLIGT